MLRLQAVRLRGIQVADCLCLIKKHNLPVHFHKTDLARSCHFYWTCQTGSFCKGPAVPSSAAFYHLRPASALSAPPSGPEAPGKSCTSSSLSSLFSCSSVYLNAIAGTPCLFTGSDYSMFSVSALIRPFGRFGILTVDNTSEKRYFQPLAGCTIHMYRSV